MNAPDLVIGNLYGLSNVVIAQNSRSVASELMWAVEHGYSKERCVSFIADLIVTILDSTLENTHVGNKGRYGPDGDPELLLHMAATARDDAINSGDVSDNARTLVDDNYDRFRAAAKPKPSKSPKDGPKPRDPGAKKGNAPKKSKGARR